MTAAVLGALAVLALLDATSFGTLLIPVWLLLAPGRLRVSRVLLFLGIVAAAYFAIGLALLAGAMPLFDRYRHLFETDGFRYVQLVVGVVLFAASYLLDSERARARGAERAARGDGRLRAWRTRAVGDDADGGSTAALAGLALTAVAIEVASMLPYLAGIGIIAAEGPGWPGDALVLLGYCLVMIAPALVLTLGRLLGRAALDAPLRRLDGWLTVHAQSMTAWVIGIVGFLLAAQAANELWFATAA